MHCNQTQYPKRYPHQRRNFVRTEFVYASSKNGVGTINSMLAVARALPPIERPELTLDALDRPANYNHRPMDPVHMAHYLGRDRMNEAPQS